MEVVKGKKKGIWSLQKNESGGVVGGGEKEKWTGVRDEGELWMSKKSKWAVVVDDEKRKEKRKEKKKKEKKEGEK